AASDESETRRGGSCGDPRDGRQGADRFSARDGRRGGQAVSDSSAGLRRKIGSAGELRSVVRTMKAVAAASIAQYERSVAALADYLRTIELGLSASFRA